MLSIKEENKPSIIGLCAGLAFALPLYGRMGPVPGSAVSLIFTIIVAVCSLAALKNWQRPTTISLWAFGLACCYIALIVRSAAPEQFDFIFDVARWRSHQRYYYDAILFEFLVVIVPLLFLTFFLSVLPHDWRPKIARGLLWAFLTVATVAALRVFQYANLLVGTNELTSQHFYNDAYGRGFSTVSYGILCVLGAVAALSLPRAWPLTALFLFVSIWLNRKTECAIIVLAICSTIAFYRQRQTALRALVIIFVAGASAVALHNDSNLITWQLLTKNISARATLFNLTAEAKVVPETPRLSSAGNIAEIKELKKSADTPEDRDLTDIILGSGLGWYSLQGGLMYPHNVLFQNYLESGLISTLPLLLLVLLGVGRRINPQNIALVAIALAMFVISLKAGELTLAGRLIGTLLFCAVLTQSAPAKTSSPTRTN